jgi:hypothetical protein
VARIAGEILANRKSGLKIELFSQGDFLRAEGVFLALDYLGQGLKNGAKSLIAWELLSFSRKDKKRSKEEGNLQSKDFPKA